MRSKTSLVIVAVLALVSMAAAKKEKLSPELQNQTGSGSIDVIVQYNAPPHRR